MNTDWAGEVLVLDSAGYGTFAINGSVSIVVPPGIYAGITPVAGSGIDINGATLFLAIEVKLKGLTINGKGPPGGANGIYMHNKAHVLIEDCEISNMPNAGLQISGSIDTKLTLRNVHVAWNGDGLVVNGPGAIAVSNSSFEHNGTSGIYVDSAGTALNVAVEKSVIAHNIVGIWSVGAGTVVHARDSLVTGNSQAGLRASIAGGAIVAAANEVSMNGAGFQATLGGAMYTMGNNVVRDNTPNIDTAGGTLTSLGLN